MWSTTKLDIHPFRRCESPSAKVAFLKAIITGKLDPKFRIREVSVQVSENENVSYYTFEPETVTDPEPMLLWKLHLSAYNGIRRLTQIIVHYDDATKDVTELKDQEILIAPEKVEIDITIPLKLS